MTGRNDPCPCGSGKKYKRCCGGGDQSSPGTAREVESLIYTALQSQQAGKPDRAEELYRRAMKMEPQNAWLINLLGTAMLQKGAIADATECFRKAIALMGWEAQFHMNLGIALMEKNDYEHAIESFNSAIALKPSYADAHYNLAKAYNSRHLFKDAELAYREALRLAPRDLSIYVNYGLSLKEQGKFGEAVDLLLHASRLFPDNVRIGAALGDVLRSSGDFVGAAEWYGRLLAIDPNSSTGYEGLAECRKFTPEDRHLIEKMENLLEGDGLAEKDRISLEFALGKALNDLADYGGAFGHWARGQALRGKGLSFSFEAHRNFVDEVIGRFSPPYFHNHEGLGSSSELPILIVGMPRSGTTLVEQIIASHPEVYGGGELEYWTQNYGRIDLDAPEGEAARMLKDNYLSLLNSFCTQAHRITDKMPGNYHHLGLVHLLFPRARIIHCLRNPLDTCISIFSKNFESVHPYATSLEGLAFYYQQYQRLMAHWRTVLPASVFLEIPYEALIEDQEGWTRRLIAHCGLEWDDGCLAFHKTERKVQTASQWQVRQPIYKTSKERWRKYEPWIGPLIELLER